VGIRENGFLPKLEYTIRKVEMAKSDALKQEIAELNKKFEAMEARVALLEASLEAKKPKKPKAEKAEKPKAEKPKAEKAKPNCPKFTAKIKEEFSKVIGDDYPEDEKEQETLKKEFQKYANAIPAEEYNTVEFATHVTNFIRTPSVASMGGGAGSGPKVMTHSDLVDVQSEVVKTDVVGIYLLDGAQVTGPLRDEEKEDLVTNTFKGKEYDVDEASGRVYDKDTEEFLGFARIKSKKFDGLIGHK
jgi:chemotaxis protein histidine kinase CheA